MEVYDKFKQLGEFLASVWLNKPLIIKALARFCRFTPIRKRVKNAINEALI